MTVILSVLFELPFLGRLGSAVGKDDIHRNARRHCRIHTGINLLYTNE